MDFFTCTSNWYRGPPCRNFRNPSQWHNSGDYWRTMVVEDLLIRPFPKPSLSKSRRLPSFAQNWDPTSPKQHFSCHNRISIAWMTHRWNRILEQMTYISTNCLTYITWIRWPMIQLIGTDCMCWITFISSLSWECKSAQVRRYERTMVVNNLVSSAVFIWHLRVLWLPSLKLK